MVQGPAARVVASGEPSLDVGGYRQPVSVHFRQTRRQGTDNIAGVGPPCPTPGAAAFSRTCIAVAARAPLESPARLELSRRTALAAVVMNRSIPISIRGSALTIAVLWTVLTRLAFAPTDIFAADTQTSQETNAQKAAPAPAAIPLAQLAAEADAATIGLRRMMAEASAQKAIDAIVLAATRQWQLQRGGDSAGTAPTTAAPTDSGAPATP